MRNPGIFKSGLPLAAAVLISTGGIGYGVHVHSQAVELTSREQAMTRTMGQLEQQIQELTERFNEKEVDKEPPVPAVKIRTRRIPVAPAPPDQKPNDDALRRVEDRYADEAQKIASAEQEVKDAREDLEDQLSSAKSVLNDSIAKTHAQLVVLQKKGESTYNEFMLDKTKDFLQVGPVSLALRKTDTKHQRYNLELIVDQVKLEKKNVNLYEPVYLTLSDQPQPVELVVNQIGKNEVRGYVSLPKYKKSELVSDASVRTSLPEASR